VDNLTSNERQILRMRFAVDKPKKVQYTAKETLHTIGQEMGISHNRVKVLEHRALDKLGISVSDVHYNRNKVLKIIEEI
tara:strand:- start:98 stop:334 length:237 start_codon:yes stop_codon:yes gene_type:complete